MDSRENVLLTETHIRFMSTTISFQHINLEYLETMTGGDAEMMNQMIQMLIDEIPTEIVKMQECVATKDWEDIFQLSHKLKTTLAFIGNEEINSLNKTIEHCSRNRIDIDEIPPMIEQLSELSEPILKELLTVKY